MYKYVNVFFKPIKTELKHFVNHMWRGEATMNVTEGLHYLDRINDGDGQYNSMQIESMDARYPSAFYPLYHLQVCFTFMYLSLIQ